MPGSSEVCKRTIRRVSPSPQGEICQSQTQSIPGAAASNILSGTRSASKYWPGFTSRTCRRLLISSSPGFSTPRTIAQAGI